MNIKLKLNPKKKKESVLGFKKIEILDKYLWRTAKVKKEEFGNEIHHYMCFVKTECGLDEITWDDLYPEIAEGIYVEAK